MCGIYGYNGDKPPKEDKLKILGMYNLARGDDSCGMWWDGKSIKGVDKLANIGRFLESTTLKPIEKFFTVICHTRKSTAGASTLSNSHPFSYWKEEQNPENIPFAVAAHNGTIKNREELLTKYKVKSHCVDSAEILNIIIDSIINKKNINVLEEYEGFGAFVWTYPESNKLYVFRGKSGRGEDLTGERPLFYWKKAGVDEIYISSIKESLLTICDDDEKVIKEFVPNKIYVLDNGKLSIMKREFDRSARNIVETTTNYYNHNHSCTPKVGSEVFINFPEKTLLKFNSKIKRRDGNGDAMLEDEPCIDLDTLRNLTGNKGIGTKIVYRGGRYLKNGHPLGAKLKEGQTLKIDDEGYPEYATLYNKNIAKEYYFWNGWNCINGECLEMVLDMYKSGVMFEDTNRKKISLYKIVKLFDCIIFNDDVTGGYNCLAGRGKDVNYSSHTWSPLFNQHKSYTFHAGFFKKCVLDIDALKPKKKEAIPSVDVFEEAIIVEETKDVLTIAEPTESEVNEALSHEAEVIETFMMESMDEIDTQKTNLESLDVSDENAPMKERVLYYLAGAYKYLYDEWSNLSKSEEELKETFY